MARVIAALAVLVFISSCCTRSESIGSTDSGRLFVAGNDISRPFNFEIRGESLYVNRIRLIPVHCPDLEPRVRHSFADSVQNFQLWTLQQKAFSAGVAQIAAGRTAPAPESAMIAEYRQSRLIDSVRSESDPGWFAIFPHGSSPWQIEAPTKIPPPPLTRTALANIRRQHLRAQGLRWLKDLSKGYTVLVGCRYESVAPYDSRLYRSQHQGPRAVERETADELIREFGSTPDARWDLAHPVPLDSLR